MRSRRGQIGIGFAIGLVSGGACLIAQGPLPGDMATTRMLQALTGEATGWAEFFSEAAKAPRLWLMLLVAVALAHAARGFRYALVPAFALALVTVVDRGLRLLVFAPRPDASLVDVAAPISGSGLPSTTALVYGALLGAAIFGNAPTHAPTPSSSRFQGLRLLVAGLSAAGVAAGCGARIVLAGHWPSQILASLALAFAIVGLVEAAIDVLIRFAARGRSGA